MNKSKLRIATPPWWKFWHVWMVIAGPVLVVVASLVTFYFAVTRPEQIVSEGHDLQGTGSNKASGHFAPDASSAPALQARNHAATGVVPASKP